MLKVDTAILARLCFANLFIKSDTSIVIFTIIFQYHTASTNWPINVWYEHFYRFLFASNFSETWERTLFNIYTYIKYYFLTACQHLNFQIVTMGIDSVLCGNVSILAHLVTHISMCNYCIMSTCFLSDQHQVFSQTLNVIGQVKVTSRSSPY